MNMIVLAAAMVALFPVAACSQVPDAGSSDMPSITGIRGHLFQNKTGTLSGDVLAPGAPELWNSFAGPGAANATVLVLEISGLPGSGYSGAPGSGPRYRAHVVARETGQPAPLLDQAQAIPVLSDEGKAYLVFVLYQGGCAPVTVTASVEGIGSTPVERSLDFACGE